jgi:Flp pilus assembly protein TadG
MVGASMFGGKNLWLARARRACSIFRRSEGAVAIPFAFALLGLVVLGFGLLDLNRAITAKQKLQDSLDTAALMAARSSAQTDAALQTVGGTALATNLLNLTDATLDSSSFHLNGHYVDATATVELTPIILDLWQTGGIYVTANAQVIRTVNNVEVALVLDNTGSMAQSLGGGGSKIAALTAASNAMVDTLAAAAAHSTDPNAVKFAVVPFSQTVNVGSTYQNAGWISPGQPPEYPGTDNFSTQGVNRFTLLQQMGLTWGGCIESRPAPYDIQDTAPSSGATLFVPYFAPDEPDNNTIPNGGGWYNYSNNNWITNDQVVSNVHSVRQGNVTKYAASNAGAIVGAATGGGTTKGPNRDCSITSLMRLTTSAAATKAKLNSMTANGNTNVAMGLIWGWHVLSPNAPFADGVPYGTPHVDKIIVLLTDGDNTNNDATSAGSNNPNASIYTGIGYIGQLRLLDASNNPVGTASTANQRRDAIDSREAKICANMKAQNMIIYSIGVGVSNHSKAILQACASGADHYYDVTNSAQLDGVFASIAGAIENLRISH